MTTISKKWAYRFIALAEHIAEWSKDPSTKVGAVVVGSCHEIRATGYNGPPRGVNDNIEARWERPLKYDIVEHAERNSIYQAAMVGVSLRGCTMYVSGLPPCTDCARAIIQVGLSEIVYVDGDVPDRWLDNVRTAETMLREAGITVTKLA